VRDVTLDYPHFVKESERYHSGQIRSWMGIPILRNEMVVGMICFDHPQVGFFTQKMKELAANIATQIAISLANTDLYQKLEREKVRLDELYQLSTEILEDLDHETVINKILQCIMKKFRSNHAGIALLDEVGKLYKSMETETIGLPLHQRARDCGVTRQVIDSKKPVFYDEVLPDKKHNPVILQAGFKSYAGLPIFAGERVIAVLFIHSREKRWFSRYENDLKPLCSHAGRALEHASLYAQKNLLAEQQKKLLDLSKKMIVHSDLEDLLGQCVQDGARIFEVEDCSLYLKDEGRRTIDLRASTMIPPEVWRLRDAYLDRPGLTAWVAREGRPLNYEGDEYKLDSNWAGHSETAFVEHLKYLPSGRCLTLYMAPIQDSEGRIQGVLKLENRTGEWVGRKFFEDELPLLASFATQLGLAIERAKLVQRLDEKARLEIKHSFSNELHHIKNFLHGPLVLASRTDLAAYLHGDTAGLEKACTALTRRPSTLTARSIAYMKCSRTIGRRRI
jgi:GAF domain-containing protein